MNQKIGLAVIIMMTLGTTVGIGATGILQQSAYGVTGVGGGVDDIRKRVGGFGGGVDDIRVSEAAPLAITGDNIYVAWWTNKTGNNEVLFRASTDAGKTFGDKIDLSNTTNSDSTRVEIVSDANSVVVTWWERNQTSNVPVMRVSTDNGETFGETIMLSANGPIG